MASKFTRAAEGESCIACSAEDGTTVLAHRNQGKGMGIKVPDHLGLDLCAGCHYWYDQSGAPREEKRAFFNENYPKQVTRWIKKGVLG